VKHCKKLRKHGKKIVVCGEVKTAHEEIDLARPKENSQTSGFLPEEREWIDKFLAVGFIDTFRMFNSEPENYTWWDMITRARERNVGWRIDYFYASENLKSNIKSASILPKVMGSDHCPIELSLKF
jgi:exodeoxyribonuclease-3